MKLTNAIVLLLLVQKIAAQNIQLHYDARHSFSPEQFDKNFASISFEYFKELDSLGSFLFKLQSDLNGTDGNVGQTFVQVSQTLKFWKPKVYLGLTFSGGLGVAPPNFGFYLSNSYATGISVPFQWKGAYFSSALQYRYTNTEKAGHDLQAILYIWKGMLDFRLIVAGGIVSWTENKFSETGDKEGKKFVFFGDPQVWYRVFSGWSVGTRVNLYYNIFSTGKLDVLPTLGIRYAFD